MTAMDRIANVVESLMTRTEAAVPVNTEDYINPADDLLYCGNCHTAKQCRITFCGKEYTPYCACRCRQEEFEAERAERRKRQLEADMRGFRSASGITPKLLLCRFENYGVTAENEKAYRICKKYADNFGKMLSKNQGLLLWGGVGTGKTFSAACIANVLLDAGVPVIMTSFVTLLGTSKGFDIDTKMIESLNQAKLLIIDDLGAERSTDFALEKVYSIIDGRYSAGLPMILTTNLELPEMQNCSDIRYKRVYERILEVCYPVRIGGQSRRKDAARDRFTEMREFFET